MYKIQNVNELRRSHPRQKNDYQEVEVDYTNPESPTQRVCHPVTRDTPAVADIDSNEVHDTDDTVKQSGLQTQTTARHRPALTTRW